MFWRKLEPNATNKPNKILTLFATLVASSLIIIKFIWRVIIRNLLLPTYQFFRWFKYQFHFNKQQTLAELLLKVPAIFFIAIIVLFIAWRNVNADEIRLDSIGRNMALYRLTPTVDNLPVSFFAEEIVEGRISQNNNSYFYQDVFNSDMEAKEKENFDSLQQPVPGETELGLDQNALILPIINDPEKISKTRDSIVKYTISEGDTISSIAANFGLKITTVLWANDLTVRSVLKLGQNIIIPPLDGVVHTIKKGDNIGKLAKIYGADADAIVAANKLASANDIRINQELIIPGGKPVIAAPSAVPYRQTATAPSRTGSKPGANAPAVSGGKLLWPTTSRRLSQYFNWRHYGIDIPNKVGQPIYAIQSGVVETAGWNRGGYGYYVIVNHGNGMRTLYAHSSELYVSAGDRVTQGQVISAIGNTGRSTGPHLHFEIRINGKTVNPLSYIR